MGMEMGLGGVRYVQRGAEGEGNEGTGAVVGSDSEFDLAGAEGFPLLNEVASDALDDGVGGQDAEEDGALGGGGAELLKGDGPLGGEGLLAEGDEGGVGLFPHDATLHGEVASGPIEDALAFAGGLIEGDVDEAAFEAEAEFAVDDGGSGGELD